jgi:hypothetical protein
LRTIPATRAKICGFAAALVSAFFVVFAGVLLLAFVVFVVWVFVVFVVWVFMAFFLYGLNVKVGGDGMAEDGTGNDASDEN